MTFSRDHKNRHRLGKLILKVGEHSVKVDITVKTKKIVLMMGMSR